MVTFGNSAQELQETRYSRNSLPLILVISQQLKPSKNIFARHTRRSQEKKKKTVYGSPAPLLAFPCLPSDSNHVHPGNKPWHNYILCFHSTYKSISCNVRVSVFVSLCATPLHRIYQIKTIQQRFGNSCHSATTLSMQIIRRPGQSQELFYKHCCNFFYLC